MSLVCFTEPSPLLAAGSSLLKSGVKCRKVLIKKKIKMEKSKKLYLELIMVCVLESLWDGY